MCTTSLVALGLLAVTSIPSHAADIVWTGANSTLWTDTGNWLPNTLPAFPDNAVIDTTSPHPVALPALAGQASNIYIGQNASGQLTISGGGTMNSVNGFVGNNAGSNGTVTVDGFGSVWFSVGVNVGVAGTGTLTIQNSGTVTGSNGLIGSLPGSSGTVTVTGPVSSWSMSDDLYVGANGTGALTIKAGGAVDDLNGRIGFVPGSSGSVTVTGPGSSWTNAAELYVGTAGTGTLTIADGGVVRNGSGSNAYVGYIFGSSGGVTVDGAGSSLVVGKDLNVGYTGRGALNVQNGGAVSNVSTFIGSNVGSNGSVTVNGAGSSLSSAAFIYVGYSGTGTLDIQNGGTVTTAPGVTRSIAGIGYDPGSNGTVTIDGAGSSWTHGGFLDVGVSGTGTLTIQNGATASMLGSDVGFAVGSNGAVTVTGSGSSWTMSDDLYVGANGTGALTIKAGGAVDDLNGRIGFTPSSSGSVTVTGSGSSWTNAAELYVGTAGTGTLTIADGGVVRNGSGSNAYVGYFVGSSGGVTVDGAGSSLVVGKDLKVGYTGRGALNVQNGGAVSNVSTFIGSNVGSNGSVTVNGAGSSLSSAAFIYVGYSGTGTLDIQNGGTVNTAPGVTRGIAGIGYYAGSNGTVTIDGAGSSWTHGGVLDVGGGGTGTLTIQNGATASMLGSAVGFAAGSNGAVTVTGSGSSWSNSFVLLVGDAGTGSLTIQNGGSVSTPLFAVANETGSTGTVNIGAGLGQAAAAPGTLNTPTVTFGSGNGSIVFNHTSANYTFDPVITGAGSVLVEAGRTILTANSTYTGTTTVDGGTLSVNGSIASSSLTSVNAGGTLGGNGTVGNLAIASGGTVAPGNSIGTLNVSGNVSFAAGSIYQVEANAAGQSDRIIAAGKATLGGGSVLVLAQNGTYAPQTTYTILTANSGVTGTFADVTSSLTFLNPSLTYDPGNVYLTLARNSTTFPDVAQTPNQLAVSNALEASAQTSPLVISILNQNVAGARQAFDALSGELHASTQTAMLDDSRYLRDAVLGRLRQSSFAESGGPMAALSSGGPQLATMDSMAASSALAYAGGSRPGFPLKAPPLAAPARIPDTTFWAQGVGAWGRFGGDGNASGMTRDLAGFFSGVDHRFAPNWIAGIAGGYTNSSLRIGDRSSSANIDTAHLAGYVGGNYGAFSLRGGAGASFSTLDTSRSIIFPDFFDSARARYNATTAQVFGDNRLRLQPPQDRARAVRRPCLGASR
ncbi:outer membrane autotransporter protein [Bradyrhizobium sp. JR6.1]